MQEGPAHGTYPVEHDAVSDERATVPDVQVAMAFSVPLETVLLTFCEAPLAISPTTYQDIVVAAHAAGPPATALSTRAPVDEGFAKSRTSQSTAPEYAKEG